MVLLAASAVGAELEPLVEQGDEVVQAAAAWEQSAAGLVDRALLVDTAVGQQER